MLQVILNETNREYVLRIEYLFWSQIGRNISCDFSRYSAFIWYLFGTYFWLKYDSHLLCAHLFYVLVCYDLFILFVIHLLIIYF